MFKDMFTQLGSNKLSKELHLTHLENQSLQPDQGAIIVEVANTLVEDFQNRHRQENIGAHTPSQNTLFDKHQPLFELAGISSHQLGSILQDDNKVIDLLLKLKKAMGLKAHQNPPEIVELREQILDQVQAGASQGDSIQDEVCNNLFNKAALFKREEAGLVIQDFPNLLEGLGIENALQLGQKINEKEGQTFYQQILEHFGEDEPMAAELIERAECFHYAPYHYLRAVA